jgi:DUF4097 and DUF4098 domain-containing protein YvlB
MKTTSDAGPSSSLEVPIEPGGTVDVNLTSASLTLRGGSGDRVVVRTLDGEPLGDNIRIEAEPGVVRIRDVEGGWKVGPVSISARRSRDIAIDLPRTALVALRTLNGDVVATGIGADSRWSTASGDLRLAVEGGHVQLESMSGDAVLEATGTLTVAARTASGDLHIRGRRFERLDATTTSGDVHVEGDLAQTAPHAITSVSGDVELVTSSPVRLQVQTITGDVRATGRHQAEGGRGMRTLVVGDGSVEVTVRTTSGDVRLRSSEDGEKARAHVASPRPVAPVEPVAPVAPVAPVPPVPPAAPVPPSGFAPGPGATPPLGVPMPAARAAEAPDASSSDAAEPPAHPAPDDEPAPRPIDPEEDTHAWNAAGPVADRREADRLEVLRALERGDVDIETAARRLEALEQAGPRYFRGWC